MLCRPVIAVALIYVCCSALCANHSAGECPFVSRCCGLATRDCDMQQSPRKCARKAEDVEEGEGTQSREAIFDTRPRFLEKPMRRSRCVDRQQGEQYD